MPFNQFIPSFNAGELSPYLRDRSDIEKYASGCKTLENFIIMPYGGVQRRPGTEYLGGAKLPNKKASLVGFNFSTTTSFILEFGDLYIRFWKNGARVEVDGNPVELTSPYAEADIQQVQYVQINDVMFFAHPSYPPYKLSRLSDTNWTFEELIVDWPALLDENTTSLTLAASATSGTGVTLTASAPNWVTSTAYVKGDYVLQSSTLYKCIVDHTAGTFATDLAASKWQVYSFFSASSVGAYYQLGHSRASAFITQPISSNTSSSGLTVLGTWEFTTNGIWNATVSIERSRDGGATWESIRVYDSDVGTRNISATGNEETECLLRVKVSNYTSNTNGRAYLSIADAREYGFCKVTGYTSPRVVTVSVLNALNSTSATKIWSEGAWSASQGYPRTVALHEQRVYYGGTAKRPQSIWGSNVDDFQNFRLGTTDDAGLFFSISSQEANPIQWITSQDQLLIGTAGDEWTIGSTTADSPITPSNVRAAKQSSYGSKYLRALVVNDVILFVQRQGRKVRELVYQFEKQGWTAPDLTVLAEHVTRGEIQQIAFQQQPDSIYWIITPTGLVGMTYDRQQNVVGWHRHSTDGVFESVATIYGASGPDEVWFVVKREIDGQTVRYIERFRTDYREVFDNEDKPNWWYLDCAKYGTFQAEEYTLFDSIDLAAEFPPVYIPNNTLYGAKSYGPWDEVIYAFSHEDEPAVVNDDLVINGTVIDPDGVTNAPFGGATTLLATIPVGETLSVDILNVLAPDSGAGVGKIRLYTKNVPNSVTGLSHLEGKTVSILADGAVHPDRTVSDGTIVLQNPASKILVGLGYTSTIEPMNLEMQLQSGSSKGAKKRIYRASVSFLKSLGGEVRGAGTTKWDIIPSRAMTDNQDDSPPVFTGEKEFPVSGNHTRGAIIALRQKQPLPLTVLSISAQWEPTGT